MSDDNAFHPGEYLIEELHGREWSVAELSRRTGIDPVWLQEILECQRNVTRRVGERLARAFGQSPETWLALQAKYDTGNWTGGCDA